MRRGTSNEPLLRTLAEREPELRAHVADVSSLAVRVGEQLGLARDELEVLRLAAELHDVGKLAIPDIVLQKAAALDATEWGFIHSHTLIGQRILGAAPALRPVGAVVRSTHENWDGTGYPDGFAGEAIPLSARIISACDAYSAMTSDRPYRAARRPEDAICELRRCAGHQFDANVVDLLCAVLALRAPRLDGLLGRIDGGLVGDQVAELRVAVRAEPLVQGDGVDGVERLDDVLELEPRRLGQLLRGRLATKLCLQLGRGAVELDPALLDVDRDANRLGLVRDRALAGLTDPPGRVGRELVALAPVELLRGAVEADHALLDQVEERYVVALVALRDRDDQTQVGVDHLLLRCEVTALDALRERNLVRGREKLVPPRRVHEELQRVERARDRCGCDRTRLLRRLLAYDDVALFERGAETGDVVLGQLVLDGESLNVLLLDEAALGGLLEQALDRREVVQVNGVAQGVIPFGREGLPDSGAHGRRRDTRLTTAASPPLRVIERRCTEVHSQKIG